MRRAALIEREAELEAIAALAERARAGHGRVAVVTGPAGSGKTSLMDTVVAEAEACGMTTLYSSAVEFERNFGFGVARDLVQRALAGRGEAELADLLSGAAGLVAPLLGGDVSAGSAGADIVSPTTYGLYWLVAGLAAERPLVVAVDDAQWSDSETLRWLLYLGRRIEELPVLVVVAARPVNPDTEPELMALTGLAVVTPIELSPLSPEASTSLVRRSLSDADEGFCAACHHATAGNPFMLEELVRALEADGVGPTAANRERVSLMGTRAISQAVLVQLARISPAAAAMARGAAIFGSAPRLADVAAVADLSLDDAAAAADVLTDADILASVNPIQFRHPVVRASIYADIPDGERGRNHQRAAEVIRASGGSPERIAAHLALTPPSSDPATVTGLLGGADRALALGGAGGAQALLERALAEPPAPDQLPSVLHMLGLAEALQFDPAAVDHLTEAMALGTDPVWRGQVARTLTPLLALFGRLTEARSVLDDLIAELHRADPDLALALQAELAAVARVDSETRNLAREHTRVLADLVPPAPGGLSWAQRLASINVALEATLSGQPLTVTQPMVTRAVGGSALLAQATAESPFVWIAGHLLIWSDLIDEAREFLSAAVDDATRRGSAAGLAFVLTVRAHAAFRAGDLGDAEADIRASFDLLDSPPPYLLPQMVSVLVDVLVDRGETEAAAEALDAHHLAGPLPVGINEDYLLGSRCRFWLAQNRPSEALADARALCERRPMWNMPSPVMFEWRSTAACAMAMSGERDAAIALAAEEAASAHAIGASRSFGVALRAQGLATGGDDGIALLEQAGDVLAGSTARLEHARTLCDLGAALRRANRRKDAREPLRHAMDLAHSCGATAILTRAEQELRATGARPRRVVRTGVDALTPSELRVAQLAATGMTNRDIAQSLFVTVKTIEDHLSHTYAKLGIRSRTALVDFFESSSPS